MMRSRVVGMGLAWLLVLAAAGGAWAGAPRISSGAPSTV